MIDPAVVCTDTWRGSVAIARARQPSTSSTFGVAAACSASSLSSTSRRVPRPVLPFENDPATQPTLGTR